MKPPPQHPINLPNLVGGLPFLYPMVGFLLFGMISLAFLSQQDSREQKQLWQPIVEVHQPALTLCATLQPQLTRLADLLALMADQNSQDAYTIMLLSTAEGMEQDWMALHRLQEDGSTGQKTASRALEVFHQLRLALPQASRGEFESQNMLQPLQKLRLMLGYLEKWHGQAIKDRLLVPAPSLWQGTTLYIMLVMVLWAGWLVQKGRCFMAQQEKVWLEMVQQKQEAEQANLAKSYFLVNMSHETRTPLNTILGMVEMLQEAALSREHLQYLSITHAASENLLAMVNTIVDLSRLESGQLLLEERPINLNELVQSIGQMMALRVKGKQVTAKVVVDESLPNYLLGDGPRLAQILFHLAANGVKYTESGQIQLSVRPVAAIDRPVQSPVDKGREETKVWLAFQMQDSGSGMDESRLVALRQRLAQHRVWSSDANHGVGLFLCQKLVNRMGGVLEIQSAAGEGSTVRAVLPFHIHPDSDQTFTRLRILVIHADGDHRQRLGLMLKELGCKSVVMTENGQQGLAHFRQACIKGPALGLVILECGLIDMEWMRVGGEIRLLAPTTPLVLIPHGQCSPEVLRQSAIKVNATLLLPVTTTALAATLKAALNQDALLLHPPQPVVRDRGTTERPWRILTVDDSDDSLLLIQAYLRGLPFRVDAAANGEVALEKLRFNQYDLIFMDLQMPVLDGLETTRRFRQWEADREENPTPVIALTAHALGMDEQQAMAAGCNLYLTKPIRKQELLDVVHKILPQS